jgi:hypothetical protein
MSRPSSQSRAATGISNIAGSAAFLGNNDRERQRTPEMELFSHGRKPRSNFRRPSSLGLAKTPLPKKTESSGAYKPVPVGRSHIVAPLKDHLKPEGGFERTSEAQANYRNLSPARPVINKINDHLKPEGDFAKASETTAVYHDLHPQRPVIHKLCDHSADVQPEGRIQTSTESGNYKKMSKGGEIVQPAWVSNFEKVTIN